MRVKQPSEVSKTLIERATERKRNPRTVWGLSWGDDMPKLNEITGGIQEKNLIVLISRPNGGKSALVAKWALNAARAFHADRSGRRVKIATLEMSAESYQNRMGAFLANVSLRKLSTGFVTDAELARYQEAQITLAALPLDYLDAADSFDEIERFVLAGHDAGLFALDHIGLVPGFVSGQSAWGSAATVSIRLAKLAHQNVAAIILAHQNRQSLSTEDKRPTPESVAGSDQITRDADLILGLYRADMFTRVAEEQALDPKPGELLILKNREGRLGTDYMIFNPLRTDWKEDPALNGTESKRAANEGVISAGNSKTNGKEGAENGARESGDGLRGSA